MKLKHTVFGVILSSLMLLPTGEAQAQNSVYKYRVYFKDKKESPYSKRKPEAFLSKKSLLRRAKWGIKIDDYDMPVSPSYVKRIAAEGAEVLCLSKWKNTALVQSTDSAKLEGLASLPFVSKVKKVFNSKPSGTPRSCHDRSRRR